MTKLTPDKTCDACGSMLVPPEVAPGFTVPKGTDYVCLKCGRPYRWVGNPPHLVAILAH
jgi:hypothetical protein